MMNLEAATCGGALGIRALILGCSQIGVGAFR